MSSIRICNLTKTFEGHRALDNITLEIKSGEMVALIGASGSGKSTLLRHVSGLTLGDRRGEGLVQIGDRCVQKAGRLARDVRALRTRTGFIFQQFNLVGRMPVLTNVLAGMLPRIPVWRSLLKRFDTHQIRIGMEALERVGIADQAWQRASTLSGGQQQRAAIARTLVQGAESILADEPIASLDPESSRRVMEILSKINRHDGTTVLVSLHQVQVAQKYCPRAIALHRGRVVFDGCSDALTTERLREIYGTDVHELYESHDAPNFAPEAPPAFALPTSQPAFERVLTAARSCA